MLDDMATLYKLGSQPIFYLPTSNLPLLLGRYSVRCLGIEGIAQASNYPANAALPVYSMGLKRVSLRSGVHAFPMRVPGYNVVVDSETWLCSSSSNVPGPSVLHLWVLWSLSPKGPHTPCSNTLVQKHIPGIVLGNRVLE